MDLNEIIENNTIDQISRRTRLTHENLEKLFANDFKYFTKVQALGFISILEREYRADLSSLRDKCIAFFSDGVAPIQAKKEPASHMQSTDESPIIAPMNIPKGTPRYVKPTIIGLVAIGLLYAAWQTFASNMQIPGKASGQEQNAGFFSSMSGQSDNITAAKENKTDIDTKVIQKDQDAWANKEEAKKNTFAITNQAKRSKTKDSKSSEDKKVDEENEIIKNVKAQQAQVQQAKKSDKPSTDKLQSINNAIANANDTENQNALSPEVPSVSKNTTPKQVQAIKNKENQTEPISQKAEELAKKRAAEDAAKQKAEAKKVAQQKAAEEKARKLKIAQQKAAEEKVAKAKAAREAARKKALAAKAAKQKEAKEKAAKLRAAKAKAKKEKLAKAKAAKLKAEKEKAAKAKEIKNAKYVIKPSKSIWLGIVDLRTMKRRTYTGKGVAAFNKQNGRWIIATSHGYFSFRAGNRVVRFNNNRKHYLIIQKGNIHEIPHATFQKLNRSKAW